MFSLLFFFLISQLSFSVSKEKGTLCCLERTFSRTYYRDGDLIIGGFFPLVLHKMNKLPHWKRFFIHPQHNFEDCQWLIKHYYQVLALMLAIEDINRNLNLLPNITLGFHIYNAYANDDRTLESSLMWLSGQGQTIPNYSCDKGKSVVVIGGATSDLTVSMGSLLELYKFPQITYGLFDPLLSDPLQFPAVYQMAPTNTYLIRGMVQLMLHFKWNWVGLVTSDDSRSEKFLRDLQEEMSRNDVCVAFIEKIITSWSLDIDFYKKFIMNILMSTAKVIVIYGNTNSLLSWMFTKNSYVFVTRIWITSSHWDISKKPSYVYFNNFHGALVFSDRTSKIPGFKHFLKTIHPSKYPEDIFLKNFWETAFGCTYKHEGGDEGVCSPNASLDTLQLSYLDMTMSDQSYTVYTAVYAVAWALHKMFLVRSEMESYIDGDKKVFHPWKLHSFLKNIHFNTSAGKQVVLDKKRKSVANYDILNYVTFHNDTEILVKVGEFNPQATDGENFTIQEKAVVWATRQRKEILKFLCSGKATVPHTDIVVVHPLSYIHGTLRNIPTMQFSSYHLTKLPPQSRCSNCSPGFQKKSQEGKPVCCFDCVPCTEGHISSKIDADQCVKCPEDQHPNKERNQCLPKVVIFLAYEEPMGMAFASIVACLSFLTALVLWVFVGHKNTPIVRANNRDLSYILLISLIFCFLCSLLFIGRPTAMNCFLRQATFAVMFTVAISSVLAKTIIVVLAFRATRPGSRGRKWMGSRAPISVVLFCTLTQILLCAIWLLLSPPFPETDTQSDHEHILLGCNEGSLIAFYFILGYMGVLALGSFTVAFLARNLPDTFNEAKFITFSMLVFCSVWVSFLPTYQSTKGKMMVAVEIFCILSSSTGLLGCIFIPKCYVILLQPHRNTRKTLKDNSNS